MEENKKLKTRVQSLDSGFLNEYGNRLESQSLSAKQMYKEAHETGDADKMIEAQELISKLAVERQRYDSAKTKAEQQAKVQVQKQEAPPQPVAQQQPQAKPDPRAETWATKNDWFGQDRVMTTAAFAIHQQLIEEEGFDPQSDEYYTAIDSRIRSEFPHKFETAKKTGGGSQVASANSSASRSTKQGRRSVKLSHSQVAIAKKLGVPLEEYAKYVKE
jgi:pyruvate/2-oxoglutarate dehydrogenase complex dihydrolipoamide acyltransferase (E2) component